MASAIEYGLVAALIAVAAVTATSAISNATPKAPKKECVTVHGHETALTLARNLIGGTIKYAEMTADPNEYRICFQPLR